MLPVTPTNPHPIPLDLRKELPDAWIPWGISKRLFAEMQTQGTNNISYKKVQALPTDPEWRFIWRYFHHDKPTRYGIKKIHCVHERNQMTAFESTLSSTEREAPKFQAQWNKEPRADQRAEVIDRWKQTTDLFSPFQTLENDGRRKTWNTTKVLPLWHGTSEEVCHSICESGFVYFGKTTLGAQQPGDPQSTDEGYFGSGIYFTNSARYTSDIYSKGHILLAWVSMREPFPVVGDPDQIDMNSLKGKGAYKNYNAHYIPVVPTHSHPSCAIYHPCQEGETPNCDEIVVFHKSQALPRFWIELEVELPYLITPSDIPQFVEELIPHIYKILQNSQVDRDTKLRNILYSELAFLLTLSGDDDLQEKHATLFHQMTQLIDHSGKIDKTIRQALTGNPQPPTPTVKPLPSPTPQPIATSTPPYTQLQTPSPSPVVAQQPPITFSTPIQPLASLAITSLPVIAFGKAKWATYFGDSGVEPPLPPNIHQILQSPCPFWPGKKVEETHLLVLIPQTVNGKPLTLDYLEQLIQKPLGGGHATKYEYYYKPVKQEHGAKPAGQSHWVLMTTDVIPTSKNKPYAQQQELVRKYAHYQVPQTLEATTCILMEQVKEGRRLYPRDPWTYTRCQEQTAGYQNGVGGFGPSGLDVFNSSDGYDNLGVGALWKF